MLLFVRNGDWKNVSRYFTVAYDEAISTVTLGLNHVNEESKEELVCRKIFDLNSMFKKNNYFVLKTKSFNGKTEFDDFFDMNNIARSRDELFAQMLLEKANAYPDVVLYFHNAADEVAVFVNGTVKTSCNYEVMDDRPAYLIAQEIYPGLKEISNTWEARRKMMMELDPNQSLAYMEAQLDVISKVLFFLLNYQPEIKEQLLVEFPELIAFENALRMTSLFTVKSSDKCLEEIRDTKKRVRELQRMYYMSKQGSK